MGKNKVGKLFLAGMTIMLCIVALIAGTYAIWTDSVTVSNHLEAGTLSLKLERVGLTKVVLDSDGYLAEQTFTEEEAYADLTDASEVNVFGIEANEKIVPGASYQATLVLSQGEDNAVAFTYRVIVKLNGESNALAKQMQVFVGTDGGELEAKGTLADYGSEDGEVIVSAQTMTKTDSAKIITVKIAFADRTDNNLAQNLTADFDLIVKAEQKTSA